MDDQAQGQLLADIHDAAAAVGEARERLRASVLAALDAGIRQRTVSEASGWTREYLRRLARAHGIGPADRTRRTAS